jgi:hypothetical protein
MVPKSTHGASEVERYHNKKFLIKEILAAEIEMCTTKNVED